jgi:hypothetical protein
MRTHGRWCGGTPSGDARDRPPGLLQGAAGVLTGDLREASCLTTPRGLAFGARPQRGVLSLSLRTHPLTPRPRIARGITPRMRHQHNSFGVRPRAPRLRSRDGGLSWRSRSIEDPALARRELNRTLAGLHHESARIRRVSLARVGLGPCLPDADFDTTAAHCRRHHEYRKRGSDDGLSGPRS